MIGTLLLAVATPSVSYVAYVRADKGRCIYMTGDVLFDRKGFEGDLRSRFDRSKGMLIYHQPNTPARCVSRAVKSARRVGFVHVSSVLAPADPWMGPPI